MTATLVYRMKQILTGLVAAALTLGVVLYDFSPPIEHEVVRDGFALVWTPVVKTDCEVWRVTQSEAALADVWPHAAWMAIDGEGHYKADETAEVPRTDDTLVFTWHAPEGHKIWELSLDMEITC